MVGAMWVEKSSYLFEPHTPLISVMVGANSNHGVLFKWPSDEVLSIDRR